jgi:DNA polymerase-3 subunit epsilon
MKRWGINVLRQIVLDTETTGIDPKSGHRIIEIGCVELIDRKLTGNNYHVYINPEREVDEGAFKVHGISNEFLADKPVFEEISTDFFDFINGAELIIHNAPFDVGFIDHEFALLGTGLANLENYCQITDTLVLARKKHPGQRNNLDALCKRYDITNFNRELHGALLDSEILALVYLAMTGGQAALFDVEFDEPQVTLKQNKQADSAQHAFHLKVIKASEEELSQHQEYLAMLKEKSGISLWEEVDS